MIKTDEFRWCKTFSKYYQKSLADINSMKTESEEDGTLFLLQNFSQKSKFSKLFQMEFFKFFRKFYSTNFHGHFYKTSLTFCFFIALVTPKRKIQTGFTTWLKSQPRFEMMELFETESFIEVNLSSILSEAGFHRIL